MTEREQRLRDIEARVEAVTPGPWKSGHYAPTEQVSVYYDQIDEGTSCIARTTYTILDGSEQSISDMNFIAHARQDVPWLLAEVRRLEATLVEMEEKARLFATKCEYSLDRIMRLNNYAEALEWLLEVERDGPSIRNGNCIMYVPDDDEWNYEQIRNNQKESIASIYKAAKQAVEIAKEVHP